MSEEPTEPIPCTDDIDKAIIIISRRMQEHKKGSSTYIYLQKASHNLLRAATLIDGKEERTKGDTCHRGPNAKTKDLLRLTANFTILSLQQWLDLMQEVGYSEKYYKNWPKVRSMLNNMKEKGYIKDIIWEKVTVKGHREMLVPAEIIIR